jgi:hypothetical protein
LSQAKGKKYVFLAQPFGLHAYVPKP